jgi:hypothetical protein
MQKFRSTCHAARISANSNYESSKNQRDEFFSPSVLMKMSAPTFSLITVGIYFVVSLTEFQNQRGFWI